MAATKKRSTKRRSNTRGKRRTAIAKRTSSHGVSLKVNPKRRTRRRNPVIARSRRGRGRRRNPVGGGVVTEAFNYSIAGLAVAAGTPVVNRFIGGFVGGLGQFAQPVVFAVTGFGLAWVAGFTQITRRFQRPLAVMGVSIGITTIITPWVRKLLSGVGLQAGAGMSGYRGRHQMRGIAAVTGTPPNILSLPSPSPAVQANQAMSGIAAYGRNY